jgi:RNA polymerase sigma factor (sigma-70 family)
VAGQAVLLHYLRRTVFSASLVRLDDRGLLDRYVAGGPDAEAAFEVIVRRHGPMVLRVCRMALGDARAEDAFQATFLVLVRRPNAVRREVSLGPWLFGVARRVCAGAGRAAACRARHEARVAIPASATSSDDRQPDRDIVAIVHAEVGRLAAALRSVLVLCDLAGLSYTEAADRLGLSHATVRGRLARARERLRRRLQRRGIGPEVIWVAPVVVPAALAHATARAAMILADKTAGAVPVPVIELLAGGLESMIWTKCKTVGLGTLTAGVLLAGAIGLSARQQPGEPPKPVEPANRFFGGSGFGSFGTGVAGPAGKDPGDEVAALVRKAERQQDRGDLAGALKTLGDLDGATRRWRDQVTAELDHRRQADDARTTPVPGGPARPGGFGGGGAAGGGFGTPPGGNFGGGGMSGSGPGPNSRLGDLEKRMANMEKLLDRLLLKLDAKPTDDAKRP